MYFGEHIGDTSRAANADSKGYLQEYELITL